jgi:hypothetical protein
MWEVNGMRRRDKLARLSFDKLARFGEKRIKESLQQLYV